MSYLEILGMIGLGIGCGVSKLGIPAALIFSPILASIYGGKASAGIIIIPVLVSDLIVMYIYRKNADKKVVLKMLPLTFLGIIVAVIFGKYISDEIFKQSMGIIILVIGILTLLKNFKIDFSKLSVLFGFLGGFAAFIGNVSGPLMSIYLLNIKMDRDKFYGTRTWFYFIVNLVKVTLYVIVLKNIHLETFKLTSVAIPFVFVGVFAGKYFVEKMNQELFEKFIVILSIISGLKLLFF